MNSNVTTSKRLWPPLLLTLGAWAVLLWVRYALGLTLFFHMIAELFAVTVAVAAFMVTWNARRYIANGYLIVVGVAYLFAAGIDLVHAMTYSGMNVIPGVTANTPTQLWLAARYIQASALLVAPFYVRRKVSPRVVFGAFAVIATVLLGMIRTQVFPDAFIEGQGLTTFKIASEYAIAAAMLAGLLLLQRRRDAFDRGVWLALSGSIALGIVAELAFTLYTDPFGPANVIGHILRIGTYYLLYRAIVETGLRRPYGVLFRELSETAEALRESEVRFRSTFEQATLGIGHVGLGGRWLRVNDRLTEITGFPADELQAMRPLDLTYEADQAEERALMDHIAAGDINDYVVEKRLVRADGSLVWVTASRAIVRGPTGDPRYYVEIVEDITTRKDAEERLRASRDLNRALADIDRTALSSLDVDEIMASIVEQASTALSADSATIVLRDGDRWVPRFTWNFPTRIAGERYTDEQLPHAVKASKLGDPVAIEDSYEDPRVNASVMRRFEIASVLVIPLQFREEDIGAFYINYHRERHRFSEEEMDFARKLAAMLTVSIENARLYQAQRQIADTLQTELLGKPQKIAGLEIAHAYRSATDLARIGGDFYDVFEAQPGLVVFVLGDVSGKGLEAATLTAMAKSTLRAFSYRDSRPSAILTAANRVIAEQIADGRFITAVVGTIDVATGSVLVGCAGHPAPIVCRSDSRYDEPPFRNPPLGLFPDEQFRDYAFEAEPGDQIIVFSDGLLDARKGSDLFGESRVHRVLDDLDGAGPHEIVDALIRGAEGHAGGNPGDDIAIVAIEHVGLTQRSRSG